MEHCVTDGAEENQGNHGTAYPSRLSRIRFRRPQSRDFILDLFSPHLAIRICPLAGWMRIWGVIMKPVKDLNVSEFLVEACQGSSPLRHIGLFYFWKTALWGRDWEVSSPMGSKPTPNVASGVKRNRVSAPFTRGLCSSAMAVLGAHDETTHLC